jgi:outer membrane protein assembly factor BamB
VGLMLRLTSSTAAALSGLALVLGSTSGASAATGAPAAAQQAATGTGGALQWTAHYSGAVSGVAMAASPDGSVIFAVGANTPLSGTEQVTATVAYNAATGALLWQAKYKPGALGRSTPEGIAVSPDGSTVFITGATQPNAHTPGSALTVAYNASTGATLWTATSASLGNGNTIAVSPDGSMVFIVGGTGSSTSPTTMALSAATGATLWTAGAGSGLPGQSLVLSPDGSTVFAVSTTSGSSPAMVTAYDATTGAQTWAHSFASGSPYRLAVSPGGSMVFVAGDGATAGHVETYVTAGYDAATGAQVWTRTYKNPAGNSSLQALAVNGSMVFVTGDTGPATSSEYGTVAYDAATGATAWVRTVTGTSGGIAVVAAVAASPDGSEVFVTGERAGLFGTVAYDAATGAKLWLKDTGKPNSSAQAATVSPDSSTLFVTGGGTKSMTTLAYNS